MKWTSDDAPHHSLLVSNDIDDEQVLQELQIRCVSDSLAAKSFNAGLHFRLIRSQSVYAGLAMLLPTQLRTVLRCVRQHARLVTPVPPLPLEEREGSDRLSVGFQDATCREEPRILRHRSLKWFVKNRIRSPSFSPSLDCLLRRPAIWETTALKRNEHHTP